ncbi:MAG: hypothetical protein IKW63_02725 [Elusimicrobiaceae bacterium]|nr:hypothetical protein [Elusimicrobiaceae bacterium]
MAVQLTLDEYKLLLTAKILEPVIVKGLKKVGFSDEDINLADKYLGLEILSRLVGEITYNWHLHNVSAFSYKTQCISIVKISYHAISNKEIKHYIEKAVNEYKLENWLALQRNIKRASWQEVPHDLIKAVLKIMKNEEPNQRTRP